MGSLIAARAASSGHLAILLKYDVSPFLWIEHDSISKKS
jgi:hypothetical protein